MTNPTTETTRIEIPAETLAFCLNAIASQLYREEITIRDVHAAFPGRDVTPLGDVVPIPALWATSDEGCVTYRFTTSAKAAAKAHFAGCHWDHEPKPGVQFTVCAWRPAISETNRLCIQDSAESFDFSRAEAAHAGR